MIKGGLQKRKKDENWYTYNSSTWVMDRREIVFQTRPQKSLFSTSETMHKLGGGVHTRAWSLCYYASSSNLVWAEAPEQEFSYQPLPTAYSSGCSSVCHNYLVLARAKCRGTQRTDSSGQALQEELCRGSHLLYLPQSHQESNKSPYMDSLLPSAQPSEESGNKVEEGQRSPTRFTFPSGNQQGHLKPWQTLFYSPLGTLSICLWWGNSSACSCQLFSFSPIIWQCPHVRLCKQSSYWVSMCLQGHYSEAFWSDSIGSYIICQQYLECSLSVKNRYEV